MSYTMRDAACTGAVRSVLAAVVIALLAGVCASACNALAPLRAYAADPDATLSVVVRHGDEESAENVDGVALSAYQVARIAAAGNYEPLDAYASTGVDFGHPMSAEEAVDAASLLAPLVKESTASATATTGKDGIASMGNLEYGVYLVVQTGASGTAESYTTLTPFLVNVPQFAADGTVYDVVATAKTTLAPDTPDEPEPDTPDKQKQRGNSSPKTGETVSMPFVVACFAVGMLAIVLAIVAARKLRRR